jgi:hypothetical protein
MKNRSFVMGVVLGALGLTCVSLPHSASAAGRVQSLGAAKQDATARFSDHRHRHRIGYQRGGSSHTFNSSFTSGGVPIVQAHSANSNLPV